MTGKSEKKAIIYCRVSSKKQAKEGNGLESQEAMCRDYADRKGYHVVSVFSDDLTGKTANRGGLKEMLAFLRASKSEIIVLIDDLNRLARSLRTHYAIRDAVAKAGGKLESPKRVYADDPDDDLLEIMEAAFASEHRRKNAEQAKDRMKGRMLNGFWVFHAPLGYRYEKSPTGGSVLVRVEPVASIIGEALNGYASGRFNSRAEVKRFMESHSGFPLCRHGFLTNEQANRILTNPVYAGYVESKMWGVSLRKGHHEGVISLETFQRNQDRLAGKTYAPARVDVSEDFPLRGFVTCGCCNHSMTANWVQGRNKKFPYYICRHRGCEKFGKSVARGKIEDAYEALLRALTPSHELVELLAGLFRLRWDERAKTRKDEAATLKLEVAATEKKIGQFLERIVESDSPAVIGAYERKVEELEREKLVLAEKSARCGTVAKDYDASFQTAFSFLSSPWNLWENGTLEDRRIALKLTLDSHLEYDWNEGVQTAEISLPFKALQDDSDRKAVMAGGVGFEPTVGANPRRFSRPLP
jgi:site-specific DNA recombinase